MEQLFADIPEAISNSLVIAKRCSVMAEERAPILPAFTRDEGAAVGELGFQAYAGLVERLNAMSGPADGCWRT